MAYGVLMAQAKRKTEAKRSSHRKNKVVPEAGEAPPAAAMAM